MVLDLNKEMAWVTFFGLDFETKWFPVTDVCGNQLDWSDSNKIMTICRSQFNDKENWVSFGIAPTSQMLMKNSVKDNL
jgi:hypothetical protein|tara:strand:+ start:360 stop:593 length:234 start_codon:yes stop_codon:yes gene_type:complete